MQRAHGTRHSRRSRRNRKGSAEYTYKEGCRTMTKTIKCTKCGVSVLAARMADHWIIQGHSQNPNVRAVSGTFAIDEVIPADRRHGGYALRNPRRQRA